MKKRILSVILSLIMLVSLVPAAAINASAASLSISESAITVLKQLEGYSKLCVNGYTGYGTLCTKTGSHSNHTTNEKEADAALREELKDLDAAVNSFASKYSLSLSQGKHDALVLFSFENGTAWTTGTGDFQSAIKSGAKGSKFLNAICWWDSSTADDNRRMIEANMYLNGVYSSARPSRFIRVKYDVGDGFMSEAEYQYYDTAENPSPDIIPTNGSKTFLGWYCKQHSDGTIHRVTELDSGDHEKILTAFWQGDEEPGLNNEATTNVATDVNYTLEKGSEVRLYKYRKYDIIATDPTGEDQKVAVYDKVDSTSKKGDIARGTRITILERGAERTRVQYGSSKGWVRNVNLGEGEGREFQKTDDPDKTVKGTLKIDLEYVDANSVRWGRVVTADKLYEDGKKIAEGENGVALSTKWTGEHWINLGDVDFDTNYSDEKVIARATVHVNGYVNVRSDAGIDNQIIGALPNLTTVDLYEIKYVNGIQWGRYSGGWFCLTYADVIGIDVDDYADNANVLAYAFTGTLQPGAEKNVYEAPGSTKLVNLKSNFDYTDRTITNLTEVNGITWGKISEGWVKVSNADGSIADVKLAVAKYYTVVDGVTVRTAPSTSATRVNNLVKGVEFNVNESKQIVVVGETIWGYADKVGEDTKTYDGWVNLASKYVSRGDAPSAEANGDEYTGLMATIVGADNVNVRIHHATYSKILGKIARGTTVPILDEEDGWYKIDYDVDNNDETDSWVVNTYVEVTEGSSSTGSSGSSGSNSKVETGLGIVANTYTGVNVRTAPGTGNALVGKLLAGSTVEILEVKTHGASKWGRVTQGWICMDYVTMVSNYEIAGSTGSSNGSSSSTSETAIYTGVTTQEVNIRKTTSLNADIVRTVSAGSPITLHEILTVTTTTTEDVSDNQTLTTTATGYWARVNDGYIYNPAQHIDLDTLDEDTYTVTESNTLNVRKNAGTGGDVEYVLRKGDQVTVTQLEIVNGSVWGFVEADRDELTYTDEEGNEATLLNWDGDGWISLAYCTKGAITIKNESASNTNTSTTPTTPPLGVGSSTGGYVTNASGYRYTGKVINTNSVNVRATASTTATITTTLSSGAALVIYETTIAENMAWGRCDAGWVYLYYVDLTPVVGGAVDARVVYNDNTIAYTDMNCSEVAGTYSRMSVIDIYEIVGKMARTDLGWVNTDNLL